MSKGGIHARAELYMNTKTANVYNFFSEEAVIAAIPTFGQRKIKIIKSPEPKTWYWIIEYCED